MALQWWDHLDQTELTDLMARTAVRALLVLPALLAQWGLKVLLVILEVRDQQGRWGQQDPQGQ